MMILTLLALLAMLYAPAHAYLDCYPNPGCKTAIGKAKISIGEKHQGVDGSWSFFSDVKYCASAYNDRGIDTAVCNTITSSGSCDDCTRVEAKTCADSPKAGGKIVCALAN